MKLSSLTQLCYRRWRLLRYQFSPWLMLAIGSFNLLFSSGVKRTYHKIHCMKAMSRIDFVGVCKTIDDLLW
ncbi:MAG: hypothetical protein MUE44_32820 [Oscillatoriaceae cyanobacterium Prado104]|jgi:hypothetical protein|nr:hypothetical protein [Oscillatoriaceae cyanobacterium Prado104]